MIETETSFEIGEKHVTVTELGALGYGDPNESISYEKKRSSGELKAEAAETTAEFILSGEGMAAINHDDDGCIDGRPTEAVTYFENGEEKEIVSNAEGHERVKVAGGGYMTGVAMTLGAGEARASIQEQLAYTADSLHLAGIVCGAHTHSHANETGTGCGANDRLKDIITNGPRFMNEIGGNIKDFAGILGMAYDDAVLQKVMDRWGVAARSAAFFEGSTGQSRLSIAKQTMRQDQAASGADTPVSVIKRLAGDHNEAFIVVNFQKGKTFSQAALRAKLRESHPDLDEAKYPEVFVVDAQRVIELARGIHEKTGDDLSELTYAGFAYQLATAATLTDGTLRTFVVQ